MRVGLITAIATVVLDKVGDGNIVRTVGHGMTRAGRRIMSKEGDAGELSEALCGTTTILLAGHLFDSIME